MTLPPNRPFRLLYWNRRGNGTTRATEKPVHGVGKTVTVEAPLHSVFAVTTLGTA